MSETGKDFWESMLQPINPNLSILIGLLNVLYGLWLFIPDEDLAIYQYLDFFIPGQVWGVILVGLGASMMYINRKYSPRAQVKPMYLNAIIWSIITGFTALGDVTNNIWILMLFVCIYSIFVASNFWVNWEYGK